MRKTYTTPGVLMGLSTDRAFRGKSVHFYIDDETTLEVDLEQPMPTEITEAGPLPGNELINDDEVEEIFFKKKLVVEYPKEVEGHIEVFVSQ